MLISILTPDFSHNCFGRAWLLAKLLQPNFDIEMIGPAFGDGVWMPLKDECDFPIKMVKGYPNGRFEFKKMLRIISGDVIYASKPLMTSFGVGLVKKILNQKPIVLDIDDWQLGFGKAFYDSLPWYKKINDFRLSLLNFNNHYYNVFIERLIPFSNSITVSGNVLQKKYGGTIIWHGRNSDVLNPDNYNKVELKKKHLNISEDKFVVGFIGTPRSHKGLEELISAFQLINNDNIFLMIVGMDDSKYSQYLSSIIHSFTPSKVFLFPEQPFELLPEYLAISDLIVIPQKKEDASFGQVPAKIFDAMAMAKPIISSNINDIPSILNDCGWIVEHDNKYALKDAIENAYNNRALAKEIGLKARHRFMEEYSWDILRKKITPIFTNLLTDSLL